VNGLCVRTAGAGRDCAPAARSGASARPLNFTVLEAMLRRGVYSVPMDTKHSVDMPGVEFLVNDRGEKRAVLIDLKKHGALWEDLYDAYLVHARRREPRESLAQVKRLLQRRPTKRRTRA
jgi:hypothetical protein